MLNGLGYNCSVGPQAQFSPSAVAESYNNCGLSFCNFFIKKQNPPARKSSQLVSARFDFLVLHCVKLPLVSGVVFFCISSVQCIPISQLFYKCNYYIKQLNQKGRNHGWFHCFPKPLSLQNLAGPYPHPLYVYKRSLLRIYKLKDQS